MRAVLAACLLAAPFLLADPARAENQMGYRLLSAQEAATLPARHGALGLSVRRSRQITDGGMNFDLLQVVGVAARSAGAQAGLKPGDQIIAVDGRVFPTIATFAAYVGSSAPGSRLSVDYMPAGGGPQQAQRVDVTVGTAGQPAPAATGMSTGTKVAIGVGAAALLGCYELGCFSHHAAPAPVPIPDPTGGSPAGR